ncbi:MAG: hypothetical protein ACJ790_13330 [Myxococcaceae bacterium]
MWAAYDRGVQTVNGYSGKVPPGYELENLDASDLNAKVSRPVERNPLKGLCTVKVPR